MHYKKTSNGPNFLYLIYYFENRYLKLPKKNQLTLNGSAPSDLNCSRAASLMSNPLTTAPIDLAAPAAANPATPPPLIRICRI